MNGTRGKFIIYIENDNISEEYIQYILDCWYTFLTGDLGLQPADAPIIYVEE